MSRALERETRNVREAVHNMTDKDVADCPAVIEAERAHRKAEQAHAQHVESMKPLRALIETIESRIEELKGGIEQIESKRPALALAIARGERNDAEDRKCDGRRVDLSRQREVLELAIQQLREELRRASVTGGRLGEVSSDAHSTLELAREEAKIEVARHLPR